MIQDELRISDSSIDEATPIIPEPDPLLPGNRRDRIARRSPE